jgi:hypothetical protein
MYYIKHKRERVGPCNICKQHAELTWDHVPPKGGIELTAMEIENILHLFTKKPGERKTTVFQNGVKFRTICAKCNNEFLGRKYDPVINEFAISVGKYLKSLLTLPNVLYHKTKPNALIRGILGHILAAKVPIYDSTFDVMAREIVLDETKKIPDNLHVFYWIYPYTQISILRDFAMPAKRGNFSKPGFFQVLKYFPIAYLVTEDLPEYEGLDELTRFRNTSIDEEVEIPIRLDRIEHQQWPEIVDRGNFLFVGESVQSSIVATPRKPTRKE